jgi:hypothetical protein
MNFAALLAGGFTCQLRKNGRSMIYEQNGTRCMGVRKLQFHLFWANLIQKNQEALLIKFKKDLNQCKIQTKTSSKTQKISILSLDK